MVLGEYLTALEATISRYWLLFWSAVKSSFYYCSTGLKLSFNAFDGL